MNTNLDSGKYIPRTMELKLPSRGITYGPGFPDTVVIGAFSWRTHSILNTVQLTVRKFVNIINAGIVQNFPAGFDAKQLLFGDAAFIIAVSRALTFGEVYKFQSSCTACGFEMQPEIKVPETLPVLVWEYENAEALKRASTIILPHCKDKIVFNHKTLQADINQHALMKPLVDASKTDKGLNMDEATLDYFASYAIRLVELNGEAFDTTKLEDLIGAIKYMDRLVGEDVEKLKSSLDDNNCGISVDVGMKCDKCEHVYRAYLPISIDFFRRCQA